ncbi:MAG: molybdate ABC transporter substrate-binding protein [Demequinaceae bacterium]|nr:molybdate ABC transporter substrate-binding protein [Demequinaceae bacterium]
MTSKRLAPHVRLWFAACGVSTLTLAACGAAGSGARGSASQADATVDVYAAASLTDVFTVLAHDYESAHPGVTVRLTFGGSSDLAAQINEGAPADVFASASEKQMADVSGHIDGVPRPFASNTLTIAVPEGNPGGVTDFESLTNPDLAVVICAPEVPCGDATVEVERALGVTLSPVSELTSVTDVVGSVASGEADAGLVYVTDLARADGVEGIAIPGAESFATFYPIAAMTTGDAGAWSRGFLDYVLGTHGQAVLKAAGFAPAHSAARD